MAGGSIIDEPRAWDSTTSPGSQLLKVIPHGGGLASSQSLAIIIDPDTTTNTTYYGFAAIGSATSAALWQVMREVRSGGMKTYTWADSNDKADNVWDDRESLTYG